MSDHWDFYFTTIGKHSASVFVDIGARGHAPFARLCHLIRLELQMRNPRPDGLSSSEEAPQLFQFEDALESTVRLLPVPAMFVARITSAKKREFYLYASSADTQSIGLDEVLRRFPDYRVGITVMSDPEWQTYLSLLPNQEQRQQIEDRKVCEVLEREGDNLTQAREIDHWIYFGTKDARDRFSAQAELMGFEIRCLLAGKPAFGDFGIQIYRCDVPSYTGISSITVPLYRLALDLGGEYDGWETMVVKEC